MLARSKSVLEAKYPRENDVFSEIGAEYDKDKSVLSNSGELSTVVMEKAISPFRKSLPAARVKAFRF